VGSGAGRKRAGGEENLVEGCGLDQMNATYGYEMRIWVLGIWKRGRMPEEYSMQMEELGLMKEIARLRVSR
jgi:hypothetical protein